MSPKQRTTITIKEKQEIIKKYTEGAKHSELIRQFGYASSTISALIKDKHRIMNFTPTGDSSTIIIKGRDLIAETERLLLIWIKEKNDQAQTPKVICEKAMEVFNELKARDASSSANTRFNNFKASKGWYDKFKKRCGLSGPPKRPKKSSQKVENAKNELNDFGEENTYIHQQNFNCEKTEPFLKESPHHSYTTDEMYLLPDKIPIKEERFSEPESSEDETEQNPQHISSETLSSMLKAWDHVKAMANKHPDVEMADSMCCAFEKSVMKYFKTLQIEREKRTTPVPEMSFSSEPSTSGATLFTFSSTN